MRCAGRDRSWRRPPTAHLAALRFARWQERGIWQQERLGAPTTFKPAGRGSAGLRWAHPAGCPWMIEEQRATREKAVALYDQTSFSKLMLQGRDALAVLRRLCANEVDVPVDRMVYTAMLNARGGFESAISRSSAWRWIASSSSPVRRRLPATATGLRDTLGVDEFATLTDVTAQYSGALADGAQRPALLAQVSPDDLSPASPQVLVDTRNRRRLCASARGAHELRRRAGLQLYVPVEMARHVYLALHDAALILACAMPGTTRSTLRIEQGRRAWGRSSGRTKRRGRRASRTP